GSELVYDVRQTTVFLFNIAAMTTQYQRIISEGLTFDPQLFVENCNIGVDGNQLHRVVVQPCRLTVTYTATVELTPVCDPPLQIGEWVASQLPAEILMYLNPSRYCESDLLARFALEEFGQLPPGYTRVQSICNWVYDHLEYT